MQTHPQTQGQNGPQRTAGHRWPCQESRQTTPRPPLLPPAGHAILACPVSEGQTDGERETPGHANPNQPNPANIQPRHTGATENKRTNSRRKKRGDRRHKMVPSRYANQTHQRATLHWRDREQKGDKPKPRQKANRQHKTAPPDMQTRATFPEPPDGHAILARPKTKGQQAQAKEKKPTHVAKWRQI